jgi:hypothetical protein
MKCHFRDNDFIVFGIQMWDVAEAVLKTDALIVFGAVSESHCHGLQNNATPFPKTNARNFFEAVSESRGDGLAK